MEFGDQSNEDQAWKPANYEFILNKDSGVFECLKKDSEVSEPTSAAPPKTDQIEYLGYLCDVGSDVTPGTSQTSTLPHTKPLFEVGTGQSDSLPRSKTAFEVWCTEKGLTAETIDLLVRAGFTNSTLPLLKPEHISRLGELSLAQELRLQQIMVEEGYYKAETAQDDTMVTGLLDKILNLSFTRNCTDVDSSDKNLESKTVQEPLLQSGKGEEEEGCFRRLCGCLASVPCASVIAWVTLVVAVSACGGSLMVAVQKTRTLLDNSDMFLWSDAVCLAVLFGMVFMAIIFLIISTISTTHFSSHIFSTPGRNLCARILNVITIVIMVMLQVAWIACTVLLSAPVWLLMLFHLHHRGQGYKCVNLRQFGLRGTDERICESSLQEFSRKSIDVLICYSIALGGAILVCLSLTFFIICASANFVHLQESKAPTYNVYKNELNGSKDSVIDTRM